MIRKTLIALGIGVLLLALALAALWFKYRDSITPDLSRHAENVWLGQADLLANRTPGELIRYTKRRLEGHPNLETLALPPLHWLQRQYERPVPAGPLPTLGKGQQAVTLPPQQYGPTGQPIETLPTAIPVNALAVANLPATAQVMVNTADGLIAATSSARPGQTIVIAPGHYRLNSRINTNAPGTPSQPITVRAAQPGQVILEFNTEVAFRVSQPYWVFENMHIRGVCEQHSSCEHAFHIYGAAPATVVRNNLIEDFNAHLKINGNNKLWPDHGLVQYNTLTNRSRRETDNPVTLVDLVGANHWRVSDNLVSNFVKSSGNQVSYGVFMKGASTGGRFERNLVICTQQDISQPGVRVGISFGGGTTGKDFCRDQRCAVEHTAGLAANNIVAHCNDFGIDVNNSNNILLAHNTLINTAGIDARGAPTSARAYGNLFDGRIRVRDGAQIKSELNDPALPTTYLENPDALNLGWRKAPDNIPSLPIVNLDFNGNSRLDGTKPGALN